MAGRKKIEKKRKKYGILKDLRQINSKTAAYIQSNTHISKKEAEDMKKKIAMYKKLCPENDVRKQFIEKQSRFLEAIIKDIENINIASAPIYAETNGILKILEEKNDTSELCDTIVHDPVHPNTSAGFSTAEEITSFANTTEDICITNNSDATLSGLDNGSPNNKTIDAGSDTFTLASQDNMNFAIEELTNKGNDEFNAPLNTSSRVGHSLCPPSKNIYQAKSKHFKNDLSWIENMKYVRVVENTEYDPDLSKLLSTWDTALPKEWVTESDFYD